MANSGSSRRDFLKKTAYVAPLVLTMNVSLAQAQVGSARTQTTSHDYDGFTRLRFFRWNFWGHH